MREHDAAAAKPDVRAKRAAAAPPQGLPQAIGNRAMTRVVARMEATDAVDALKESLAPGVLGAEQRVLDTMTALQSDTETFGTVAKDFEQQAQAPLPPALGQVTGAAGMIPEGWIPEPPPGS